jgi:HSP20 family molecular chaperone IbpA
LKKDIDDGAPEAPEVEYTMSGTRMERRHGLFPDLVDWFGAGFPRFRVRRPTIDVRPIPIELSDQDGQHVPRAGLPGMAPENDVRIPVEGGTPTIGAERTESRTEREHSEFRCRSFRRSVRLPSGIPTEGVEAAYEDGILPSAAVSASHRSGPG